MKSKINSLHDLLVHQLRDIYYAEKQVYRSLAKLARNATNEQLRNALENHRQETAEHITRLEEAFSHLGLPAKAAKCPAIDGLLEEAADLVEDSGEPGVMDAGLIASAQRVEHYEIVAYGCIRSFAEHLGYSKVAKLAGKTIAEEGRADKLLSKIAEDIVNPAAMESNAAALA